MGHLHIQLNFATESPMNKGKKQTERAAIKFSDFLFWEIYVGNTNQMSYCMRGLRI